MLPMSKCIAGRSLAVFLLGLAVVFYLQACGSKHLRSTDGAIVFSDGRAVQSLQLRDMTIRTLYKPAISQVASTEYPMFVPVRKAIFLPGPSQRLIDFQGSLLEEQDDSDAAWVVPNPTASQSLVLRNASADYTIRRTLSVYLR